jgi:hypothetical protein
VLMPKKTDGKGYYNFFFLNHVLHKIGRTPEEPMRRTHNIFHKII